MRKKVASERAYHTSFNDDSYFPFKGEYFGVRLKNVPDEFLLHFLAENDLDREGLESYEIAKFYSGSVLGRVLSYLLKRYKLLSKDLNKRGPNPNQGYHWINDGSKNKRINNLDDIPDGWKHGRINMYKMTPEIREKISKNTKAFFQTERGKEVREKSSKFNKRMKKHTRIYYKFFGYGYQDPVIDELLGIRAVDIHHIDARGMGGSKEKDIIENLMAADREVHLIYGDKKKYKDFLKEAHQLFIEDQIPYVDRDPFHEAFDILLNTKFKQLIEWKRREHSA